MTIKNEITKKKYSCEVCDFITFKKTDYERHLLTDKHKKRINDDFIKNEITENELTENKKFVCKCGKEYKYKQGLSVHKKKCNYEEKCVEITEINTKPIISQELVLTMINENKELRNQNQELTNTIKELVPQLGNNNTTNSHNTNNFNINVFLNEKCKDAINMSDFINSIEVSLEQLDYTKTQGLEKGISNVIMENMNKLSLYERPIHCTDKKRETLYIKENDTWEKDKDKSKIKKIINKTSNKNFTALVNWKDENPNYMNYDDKQAYFARTISKIGKPISEVEDKIVKKICNETYIKDNLEDIEN